MTHLHVYKPFFCLRTTRNILDSSMNTSHATGYYQLPLNNLALFLFSFLLSQILFNMINCSSVGLSLFHYFLFQMFSDSILLHIYMDKISDKYHEVDECINTLVWSQCSYLQTHCDLGWNSKAISAHSKPLTHYRWRERERKNRKKEIENTNATRLVCELMPIPLKVLTKLCHLLAISSILL